MRTHGPATHGSTPRRRARPRAGFSIVELLIAAVLGLLLVSATAALFTGQLRAFARTQGAVAVQRDLRLGLALLPADLRGASRADGDLLALTATAVELRATVASSVVCAAAGTAKTTLVLPPADMPQATLTAFHSTPRPGDTVKVLTRSQSGGLGDLWLTAAVGADSLRPVPASTAGGLCAGAPSPRLALALRWPADATAPTAAQLALVGPGMPVRVLRRVRYELYRADSGRWYLGYLERLGDGSWSPREPIAGPYDAADAASGPGVGFAYFDTTGAALAAPVADVRRVGRIDVTLRPRTQVRGGGAGGVVARDSALVRVALRNRL